MVTDADLERLANRQQAQALFLEKFQVEFSGHVRDTERLVQDFYRLHKHIMDADVGDASRLRHLEKAHRALDQAVAELIKEKLSSRLEDLEIAYKDGKDRRKWVARDIVGVGVMLILASLLGSFLTARILGH